MFISNPLKGAFIKLVFLISNTLLRKFSCHRLHKESKTEMKFAAFLPKSSPDYRYRIIQEHGEEHV